MTGSKAKDAVRGALTTTTDFTGRDRAKLRSGSGVATFTIGDGDDERLVAFLILGGPPPGRAGPQGKTLWLTSKVWFKEGTLTIKSHRLAEPACYHFTPAKAFRVGQNSNSMLIPLRHQPKLRRNSKVNLTLELKGVEPLSLDEAGEPSGSGSAYSWPPPQKQEISAVVNNLKESFASMDLSDFKLICKGKEFKCHKLMLASMSPVIKMYLMSDCLEAHQGFINIEDAEPAAVERMVKFMYTETFSVDVNNDSAVHDISEVLQLSEKYDISPLRKKCSEMLLSLMKEENSADILRLARVMHLKELEAKVHNYVAPRAKNVIKTDAWNELLVNDPAVANKIIEKLIETK